MKKIIIIQFLLYNFSGAQAQPFHKPNIIDRIQTIENVDSFMKKFVHLKYDIAFKQPEFKFLPKLKDVYNYFYDSLAIAPFTKYDFDKDGRTDLLVNGTWRSTGAAIVIMDKGNGIFETHPFLVKFSRSLNIPFVKFDSSGKITKLDCFVVDIDSILNGITYRKLADEYKTGYLEQIKCVYKFGEFIEENPEPVSIKLDMIELEKGGIFSDYYNHYTLRVFKNRKVVLDVGPGNKNLSGPRQYGTYESNLSKRQFQTLQSLVGYINLINLKNRYDAGATDPPWTELKATFNKTGSIKILDRSMHGTFGLMALYRVFDRLYNELNWNKADMNGTSSQQDLL